MRPFSHIPSKDTYLPLHIQMLWLSFTNSPKDVPINSFLLDLGRYLLIMYPRATRQLL